MQNTLKQRYEQLSPFLNERQRRLFAATEALAYGRGGIAFVERELGISHKVIQAGIRELKNPEQIDPERIRKSGGGRKRTVDTDPTLLSDLEKLIDPATRGEPDSPLRWTNKSTRKLAAALNEMGHKTDNKMVATLLHELGYSLQANRKTEEGGRHEDRDAQFQHIHDQVQAFQNEGEPVISVDTKKKELVGDFKNGGVEWQPKGSPEKVRVHDFQIPELGKVNPYGVYDLSANAGWVSVGTDHDTAAFAVESIRRWWTAMGQATYPNATKLLITADGGGSNGSRVRLWKTELQTLSDETGLSLSVCHFPPGTSKWNKIEHRLFSCITQNWRGKPLTSHEVIVNLIASTTTTTGLKVQAELDTTAYPKGIKVTDEELAQVNLEKNDFHGEWNYTISPRNR
ncbi:MULTISPECIES: ISAzo13 family transposase [Cohnella]|uniref:ISAzo13 family transposase n=1 Tax=Cohnella TaxID=329857 RepID=UPI0009BA8211|nr:MULTISPECIES: ISAzo13 family transposase [Cohnella]MBN2981037.1 ISAzo13 family transposase [Cohnella algarum]MBN2981330.1 ISAzo13 family transposase [Cohnella algarum]